MSPWGYHGSHLYFLAIDMLCGDGTISMNREKIGMEDGKQEIVVMFYGVFNK